MNESNSQSVTAHETSSPIGILGGTFDPIHFGHLRIALDVVEALALERIHLVPLRVAVHRNQPTASAEQRFAMVQAAVAGTPKLLADDRELRRSSVSYTLETLHGFRETLGAKRPICLLLGSDAFEGFMQWRAPLDIAEVAHIVVMQRPGNRLPENEELRQLIEQRRVNVPNALRGNPGGCIFFQNVTQLEISSSDIRARIAEGRSIRYLTPNNVIQLIEKYKLYA